jgi:hypothetical protein
MDKNQTQSFIVINSHSTDTAIAELLSSDIRECLKETFQQKLSYKPKSVVEQLISIIVHDSTSVEVSLSLVVADVKILMKPRQWDNDIYSLFHVVDSIKSVKKDSIKSPEPAALSLEQILKFTQQSKQKSHSFETKVCYISTELPSNSVCSLLPVTARFYT